MNVKRINVLSLFDGISCARVAIERLGYNDVTYYASEIDKYAITVSKKNYPDIIHVGDIRSVTGYIGIDLLVGGSPCQDLSIAKNNRKGLAGERSGLFWEYVRILRETNPKYFILENVNSMPKEAKETITKALGVEPIMINAALVSAQNRKRLFWTNIPNVTQPTDCGILLKDILDDGFIPTSEKSRTVRTSGLDGGMGAKTGLYHIPHGYISEKITQEYKYPTLCGQSPATKHLLVDENSIIRKLTSIECERLQSLPDNYTEGISNTQRYKCIGNAFNAEVIKHIISFIEE